MKYITNHTIQSALPFAVSQNVRLHLISGHLIQNQWNNLFPSVTGKNYLARIHVLHCLEYSWYTYSHSDRKNVVSIWSDYSLTARQYMSGFTTSVHLRMQSIDNLSVLKMFLWCVPMISIAIAIYVKVYRYCNQCLPKASTLLRGRALQKRCLSVHLSRVVHTIAWLSHSLDAYLLKNEKPKKM